MTLKLHIEISPKDPDTDWYPCEVLLNDAKYSAGTLYLTRAELQDLKVGTVDIKLDPLKGVRIGSKDSTQKELP